MADDQTTDTSATNEDAADVQASNAPDPDADILAGARNPDAVKNALQRERDAVKEAKRRADEAEARVAAFEDRDKTEQQKIAERAATFEQRATQAELKVLRLEVAVAKGLTGDRAALAERLQGNTKEELAADADKLLALLPAQQQPETSFDGGARGTPPNAGGMDGLIRQQAARRG